MLQAVVIGQPYTVTEEFREYTYPDGQTVTITDVAEVIVQPSGDHRVKQANGMLHIVAAGWRHIEIAPHGGGWTF